MQMVLESYGYRVVTAENGADALHKLRSGELPSVILLDLMMPDMDGVQFRQEQCRDPRLAAIPAILVSASGKISGTSNALGLAGLTKPVDLDVLIATIEAETEDAS
jgi:CheY-like chemotaxis protein